MNNVLRRLREEEVTTVNENTYSKMVGDFINDAKTLVEQAADWSALRKTIVVPAEAGTNQYSLAGSGDDVKVMSVVNDTSNIFMAYQTKDWFNEHLYISTAGQGNPKYFTYNGLDSNGDTRVLVSPEPDGNYSLRFDVILRETELTANSDNLLVPVQPVIHLAVALLAHERGETGGQNAMEQIVTAQNDLANAIALDAGNNGGELVFNVI